MKNRALIIVDLQNEYLPTGKLPLSSIEEATANAAKVLADARSKAILCGSLETRCLPLNSVIDCTLISISYVNMLESTGDIRGAQLFPGHINDIKYMRI